MQNADTVTITSLGTVALTGSQAVSPATTTTYTLTATKAIKPPRHATVTVNARGGLPVIVSFAPNPATIDFGQSSSLQWVVQNATTVSVSTIGTVGLTGSHTISPAATTMYTITATNAVGTVTANTTLDGDHIGADPLVYRDAFQHFCRVARRFWFAKQRRGIGERERDRIYDSHGGGIGPCDSNHHLQLHGNGGEWDDGLGANYSDRGRADRSGIGQVTG